MTTHHVDLSAISARVVYCAGCERPSERARARAWTFAGRRAWCPDCRPVKPAAPALSLVALAAELGIAATAHASRLADEAVLCDSEHAASRLAQAARCRARGLPLTVVRTGEVVDVRVKAWARP